MKSIVKATGGNWDPDHRPQYFAAGGNNQEGRWRQDATADGYPPLSTLFAVNDFASVGNNLNRTGAAWELLETSLDAGLPVFLDSGIFHLTNQHKRAHDTTMDEALALAPEEIDDFDWLFEIYVEMIREFGDQLWGYNELDQGGLENKKRTRKRLEDLGLAPIPVYHPLNDGWDYYDELGAGYDRICWGNVVQASPWLRVRMIMTAMERHKKYPDLYVHFLGLTPNELQYGHSYDSADSSTWTAAFRYPEATRLAAMGKKFLRVPQSMMLPYKSVAEARIAAGYLIGFGLHCDSLCNAHWHRTLSDEGMTE